MQIIQIAQTDYGIRAVCSNGTILIWYPDSQKWGVDKAMSALPKEKPGDA